VLRHYTRPSLLTGLGDDCVVTSEDQRPRRRPRDSLSKELILAAAEELATESGLDALTFQALGDRLHAHPTSIYRYFRDKDDLVLELVDALRARSYISDLHPSDDWLDDLRRHAQHIRAHYLRYPQFALQMAMRTTHRPTEFANVEFALDALHRGGVPDDEAVVVMRALGNFIRSTASAEAAYGLLDPEVRLHDETAWQVEYRHLDPEVYPNIARVSDRFLSIGDPIGFDRALELILDGIAQRATKD
jgi:AcrR family transcriptional regulator